MCMALWLFPDTGVNEEVKFPNCLAGGHQTKNTFGHHCITSHLFCLYLSMGPDFQKHILAHILRYGVILQTHFVYVLCLKDYAQFMSYQFFPFLFTSEIKV